MDAEGRSVAEQLRAYNGSPLDEATVTNFFVRQLGHVAFIGRFIDSSSFVFQGVKLNFASGTRIYLDDNQLVLCVWETIPNGSVSIYKGEGIEHRTALTVESLM